MRARSSAARSATSRRSISRRTRSTTSCASASSSRFPTRRRSRTSPKPSAASSKKPPSRRRRIAARRRSPTRSLATYPFHPRLKNVIALFKENEQFKQTRGLIELVSRLLKSVWERQANDVFLIGPQHFDLSIPEVRDKLTEISGMRDVIAKDLWDAQQSAHAQIIDLQTGKEAATQVGALLLTASLSTAVNAVKGLTREEMVECLVSPLREPSEFLAAFEELEKVAWYLHHTPEGRYYFDRQENLTKLLQSLAHDAPENQVDDLIRHRLREMFKPTRKTVYEDVLPLPRLEDVADRVRKGRVLLVVSPDSKIPPEEVQKFFDGLSQKNNLCVLTGDKTAMGSVEKAARQLFAAQKADGRIPKGHPQREDLERKQQTYEQDFNSTILNLFDKVLFPIQRAGKPAQLAAKALDMTRDATKPFNGEEQIEKTLTSNPLKLYLDVEKEFDAIRDKAQDLLWPENQDDARWSDVADRYAEQAGMPWLPPKGLDTLKSIACNRGLWEDLGNGYVTKKPKKKRTSAQVIAESEPDDEGSVRLRVNPQNAGPAPRIHYAEDAPVSESSPQLKDNPLLTTALRVNFLVCDPSGQYETGDPVTWSNKLVLRNQLSEQSGKRNVELFVAPRGAIRYTLDGSEPREGTVYAGPIAIGDGDVLLRAFAEADGLEAKTDFRFPAKGKKGVADRRREARAPCLAHRPQARLARQDLRGAEAGGREDRHVRRHRAHRRPGQPDDRRSALARSRLMPHFIEALAREGAGEVRAGHAGHHDLPQGAFRLGSRPQGLRRQARHRAAAGGRRAMSEKLATVDFGAPDKFGAHLFRVEIPAGADRVGRRSSRTTATAARRAASRATKSGSSSIAASGRQSPTSPAASSTIASRPPRCSPAAGTPARISWIGCSARSCACWPGLPRRRTTSRFRSSAASGRRSAPRSAGGSSR